MAGGGESCGERGGERWLSTSVEEIELGRVGLREGVFSLGRLFPSFLGPAWLGRGHLEVAPVPLPFVAARIAVHPAGWLVEGYRDEHVIVTREGGILPTSEKPPEELPEVWKDANSRWLARKQSNGQLQFLDLSDGFPVLRPISVPDRQAGFAVDFDQLEVAVTTPDQELRRWSIARIGGTREKADFRQPAVWMAFERDDSNLWIWQRDGVFRGWETGKSPGFGVPLPIFPSQSTTGSVGENHSRGTAPGNQGAKLILELEVWRSRGEDRHLTAVAGSRDLDFVAFSSSTGHLLWTLPDQDLQTWQTTLPPARVLATDHLGQRVLWAAEDGTVAWLEPSTRKIHHQFPTSKRPTSATLLDPSADTPRRAVLAFADGTIEVREEGKGEAVFTTNLAGKRPGPHRTQVYGCHGGESFLAGLLGQLTLRRLEAASGRVLSPPLLFDRGLQFFFLSQDGQLLIAIDQDHEDDRGILRVRSVSTGLDLIPPLQHPARLTWANLSSNGRALATACRDGSVRRWVFQGSSEKD